MTTITIKTANKEIKTKCRTAAGVLSAWSSGAIAINATEWQGAVMLQGGVVIGTISGGGWVPA